ncbi:nucleotidyltransferase domain-containing protein [Cuniculiplasma sp. SKW3]|uniref:nucleotidyltransferase domain-containing protein n=1 Tax=unclassified Cuniculiplasma TaxID=2619706 RepID=UPI003FD31149
MEIIEERMNKRNEVIRDARIYANNLQFRCSVILIGSFARGDFNLWSDVDILIIGHFSGTILDRLRNMDFPPGYEIIMLTPDEINRMKSKNDKFILDAFRDGVCLKDDLGIFQNVGKTGTQ